MMCYCLEHFYRIQPSGQDAGLTHCVLGTVRNLMANLPFHWHFWSQTWFTGHEMCCLKAYLMG